MFQTKLIIIKMKSRHPRNSIFSEHVALDIKPTRSIKTQPKITKFFPSTQEKTLFQNIKERSKTLSKSSLKFTNQYSKNFLIEKTTTNFKRLKTLTRLDIDLSWISFCHKGIRRLIESLKHHKNLKLLHFYTSKSLTNYLHSNILSLCKALNTIQGLPKLEIKLSFSASTFDSNADLATLLECFSKIRCFTSTCLTFSSFDDLSEIQKFIAILKKCNSLSKLNLGLKYCTLSPPEKFQSLVEGLKEIKPLKELRMTLDDCRKVSNSGLSLLTPTLKEIAKDMELQIIFKDCSNTISIVDWWLWKYSLRNNKISTKFTGKTGKYPKGVWFIVCLVLLGVVLFPFLPLVLALATSRKSQE